MEFVLSFIKVHTIIFLVDFQEAFEAFEIVYLWLEH